MSVSTSHMQLLFFSFLRKVTDKKIKNVSSRNAGAVLTIGIVRYVLLWQDSDGISTQGCLLWHQAAFTPLKISRNSAWPTTGSSCHLLKLIWRRQWTKGLLFGVCPWSRLSVCTDGVEVSVFTAELLFLSKENTHLLTSVRLKATLTPSRDTDDQLFVSVTTQWTKCSSLQVAKCHQSVIWGLIIR